MSAVKTAKMLNSLLDSQKTDRARIKELEGRLVEADTRQTAAVRAAVVSTEIQFKEQLEHARQEYTAEQQAHAAERTALIELVANKAWNITELQQELNGVRQLLAAADAANRELHGIIETLGDNLDKATQEVADLTNERTEVAQQREALNHLLDEVRERMRKKDCARESAILNRKMLSRATPGVNFK